ncbi:MAG TPA: hypothetical protein VFW66_04450 [Gemmatimonadales bacterium]|nr:hypothetical protein [Gemmatimonadales bacterium]
MAQSTTRSGTDTTYTRTHLDTTYTTTDEGGSTSPVKFGIGGGLAVPLGTLNSQDKLGWHGQAYVRFRPSGSPIGFQVDGNYAQLKLEPGIPGFPGKTQIIDGTADIVFTIPTSTETVVKPYLLGGAGIYRLEINPDDESLRNRHVTKFGLNGGAGLDFGNGPVTFFAEGRFHNIFSGTLDNIGGTSNASLILATIGVQFGGQ